MSSASSDSLMTVAAWTPLIFLSDAERQHKDFPEHFGSLRFELTGWSGCMTVQKYKLRLASPTF